MWESASDCAGEMEPTASEPEILRLRTRSLEWRLIEGDIVALDLERSVYLSINRSGVLLWRLLEEGVSRDELVQRLSKAYDLDRTAAAVDVDGFLSALRDNGLLGS